MKHTEEQLLIELKQEYTEARIKMSLGQICYLSRNEHDEEYVWSIDGFKDYECRGRISIYMKHIYTVRKSRKTLMGAKEHVLHCVNWRWRNLYRNVWIHVWESVNTYPKEREWTHILCALQTWDAFAEEYVTDTERCCLTLYKICTETHAGGMYMEDGGPEHVYGWIRERKMNVQNHIVVVDIRG